jgi:peptidoglycan/xylan/chitin deacetylase (PgdA/CDA1 family)
VIAAALAAAVLVAFMAWAVRGRSSAIFAPSVWHGPRNRPAIALTFDDGPSEATQEILDILARHNAAATFFLCGANVERLPEVAREIAAAGHEIGNHSYGHPCLFLQAPGAIEADLRRAQEVIQTRTGTCPVWFRPPYGARWFGLRSAQRRLGLTGVMWTAIGYDWNSRAEVVVARMAGQAANGAILCLHDGRELRAKPEVKETVEAVRRLVPMLLDQGYRLETLSRLLCPKN